MLVIIYTASMAALMLTFSWYAARLMKDPLVQAIGAGLAGLIRLLVDVCLSGLSLSGSEHILIFVVHALHFILVLLLLHAIVVKSNSKIYR
jgi:hypothetical protein